MMKDFIVFSAFLTAMIGGLVLAELFEGAAEFESYLHQDCVRWSADKYDKPLFTLSEAKTLLGKRIVSRGENFRPRETGKIVHLETVGRDKFLIAVYWGPDAADENSAPLTFYDKERFSRDFEIID